MKVFRKAMAVTLAAVMAAGVFTGCGNGDNNSEASGSSKEQVLLIGGIGPLTGAAASYGTSVKNGAEIAVEEINAAGGVNGIKLQLSFQDDEATAEKAKSAYEKLMDDGMKVLLGAVTSGASVALNDLTKADGILQVTPSATQLEAVANPNSFRVCFTDPVQGINLARYCYNDLKYKKVAIIFNQDDSYSTGMNDAFKEEFKKLGGEIVAETSFPNDATDFNAQLTTVKNSNADFIFMPIYNDKAAQIAIAADSKGIKLPMVGGDGWDGIIGKYLKDDQAKLVEGAIYLTSFIASETDEAAKKFVSAYREKTGGQDPDQFAANGYDAVYAIKAAIESAGIKDVNDSELNSKLVGAMTKIQVKGLTGEMTFTSDGEANKAPKFAKITNGKYELIK